MADQSVTRAVIERTYGSLLFEITILRSQVESLQAELAVKTKELAAMKLALEQVQPQPADPLAPTQLKKQLVGLPA